MSASHAVQNLPPPARTAVALENDERLDPVVDKLAEVSHLLRDSTAGRALRGEWMGHALHPALTDVPIGMFTATAVLDLFGGPASRSAAQRLVGVGLLGAVPTALTGLAEWTRIGHRAQRVGVAHAGLNTVSLGLYAGSWLARRAAHHRLGTTLAFAGSGAATAAGYLGGHLTSVRDVSSRHPAFETTREAADSLTSTAGAHDAGPPGPMP
jgi:uncharacterized membrane protein